VFPGAASAQDASTEDEAEIRLVLQITVDGLRADLLSRYERHFDDGGFKRLLDGGVVFTDAHYQHANTETIVGHATLATGAHPSSHGLIGNVWYDRTARELSYNIEDADHPLLPSRTDAAKGDQVDPAQKMARTQGRSPRSLLAPTLADGLAARHGGESKIFGVSGKDRSAVSIAGKVGKAFWFSTNTGDFVTSDYYYDAYPEWAAAWNAKRQAEALAGSTWELSLPKESYVLGGQDDRPYEVDLRGFGRTFPHAYPKAGDPLLPTTVLVSPAGDELTLDFALALLEAEELGQDDVPDLLSISFSSVDAVNHFFGPSSLENEDVIVRLDRTIQNLLWNVDNKVGLDRTLVVLSADHGMAEMPEYMTELGHAVGRLYGDQVLEIANDAGKELFGIDGLVRNLFRPYAYLDIEKIEEAGLDVDDVADALALAIEDVEGIAIAAGRREISAATDGALLRIRNNHHPSRSGEIYISQEPYWFFFERGPVAAMHGSPWRYDTHVPVVFAGAGIAPAIVDRRVGIVDVAPTMAALLGMSPPGAAEGHVLPEVTGARR
jgi:hypothetical protein